MATVYTREWIQFFTGCGIPDEVAAMYALIFYENRIQKNMLLDLNKEYLRDMGITVMGDVIAILRHAKIIHEKYIRAQILSVEENLVVEKNISNNESSPCIKKTTPLKRMLEHYTRKYNSQESETVNEVQVTLPNDRVKTLAKKGGEKIGVQRPLKKKIQISSKGKDLKEKGLEVPLPRVRRVLPENEGGYKIKMPSGTTERSKKLLEQAKKRKAKTVFDRLGESSVSSTTSEISTSSASSSPLNREKVSGSLQNQWKMEQEVFSLFKFEQEVFDTSSANHEHCLPPEKHTQLNPSVFSRLGEKTSVVSSTSSVDDAETVPSDQLPYAGILKGVVHKKNLPNTTMRADEQQQSEVNKVKKGVSVKKRLGATKSEEGPPTKRPMLKAVRRAGEMRSETTILKLSSKFNSSQSGEKISNPGPLIIKKAKADDSEMQLKIITTQAQKKKMLDLKRKIDGGLDGSPLKKVRFGGTTHRLIPASPSCTDPVNFVKNYPKLTMIISNRTNVADVGKLSSGLKIGSLNSDKLSDRPGVKARIGNKFVQGRLGKRMESPVQGANRSSKISRVKDRLG